MSPDPPTATPSPSSLQGGPALASTLGYVAGTSQAEPIAAGAWRAAELAVPILVGPRCTWHTLAGLSAEVGARCAGHCGGKVERLPGGRGGEQWPGALSPGTSNPGFVLPDRAHPSSLWLRDPRGAQGRLRRAKSRSKAAAVCEEPRGLTLVSGPILAAPAEP